MRVGSSARGAARSREQTPIGLAEPAFKCSCSSREFPCKHAIGLFLLALEQPDKLVAQCANLGIFAFVCTPDRFPDRMAAVIQRRDLRAGRRRTRGPGVIQLTLIRVKQRRRSVPKGGPQLVMTPNASAD